MRPNATLPDPRLMERLVDLLRRRPSAAAFVAGGEALAVAIVATSGPRELPEWAEDLADAMIGSLVPVQVRSLGEDDPERRVRLAASAAILSSVRPRLARTCDHAIAGWVDPGAVSVGALSDPDALSFLALLCLLLDDAWRAASAVDALVDRGDPGVGWLLHDWAICRRQVHGCDRETQCFHHLRLALGHGSGRADAMLVLLGAVAAADRADRHRDRVLDWLDEVASEVAEAGTSRRSAVG